MDNKKIGKLIAELRKKQGLTQQDLGDKVGVGFKAVSKWECGTTLPDITIINEVSQILGITTDELLAGELNEPEEDKENNTEDKKKKSPKLIITISIITIILVFITSIFIYQNNNKTYTYKLGSENLEEYYIKGKAYLKNDKITMNISEILFKDEKFKEVIIENYEYSIIANDKILFGYGFIGSTETLDSPMSIREFTEILKIDFEAKIDIKNTDIIKNSIILKFKFLTSENEEIIKELEMELKTIK